MDRRLTFARRSASCMTAIRNFPRFQPGRTLRTELARPSFQDTAAYSSPSDKPVPCAASFLPCTQSAQMLPAGELAWDSAPRFARYALPDLCALHPGLLHMRRSCGKRTLLPDCTLGFLCEHPLSFSDTWSNIVAPWTYR